MYVYTVRRLSNVIDFLYDSSLNKSNQQKSVYNSHR